MPDEPLSQRRVRVCRGPGPIQLIRAEAVPDERRHVQRGWIEQPDPGQSELAVLHRDAASLLKELAPVADANRRGVDAAQHGMDAAESSDLPLLLTALHELADLRADGGKDFEQLGVGLARLQPEEIRDASDLASHGYRKRQVLPQARLRGERRARAGRIDGGIRHPKRGAAFPGASCNSRTRTEHACPSLGGELRERWIRGVPDVNASQHTRRLVHAPQRAGHESHAFARYLQQLGRHALEAGGLGENASDRVLYVEALLGLDPPGNVTDKRAEETRSTEGQRRYGYLDRKLRAVSAQRVKLDWAMKSALSRLHDAP